MTAIEKLIAITGGLIGLALVLSNPNGTKQAGASAGDLYKSIVGAFVKPS
jgi:hypothetical protein